MLSRPFSIWNLPGHTQCCGRTFRTIQTSNTVRGSPMWLQESNARTTALIILYHSPIDQALETLSLQSVHLFLSSLSCIQFWWAYRLPSKTAVRGMEITQKIVPTLNVFVILITESLFEQSQQYAPCKQSLYSAGEFYPNQNINRNQ